MNNPGQWLAEIAGGGYVGVDGLVPVQGYIEAGRPPEEVFIMEKARRYEADAVFFQAPRNGGPPTSAGIHLSLRRIEE